MGCNLQGWGQDGRGRGKGWRLALGGCLGQSLESYMDMIHHVEVHPVPEDYYHAGECRVLAQAEKMLLG